MTTDAKKFHGMYRGVVASNVDPQKSGRLFVRVEDVLGGDACIWANPASPLAGQSSGMYVVPLVDSGVWILFEDGDLDRAVWTGFWRGGSGEVPKAAQAAPDGTAQIVLGTPKQSSLLISDASGETGGIQLQFQGAGGAYIKIYDGGVEISAGKGKPTLKVTSTNIDLDGGLTVSKG